MYPKNATEEFKEFSTPRMQITGWNLSFSHDKVITSPNSVSVIKRYLRIGLPSTSLVIFCGLRSETLSNESAAWQIWEKIGRGYYRYFEKQMAPSEIKTVWFRFIFQGISCKCLLWGFLVGWQRYIKHISSRLKIWSKFFKAIYLFFARSAM